MESYKNVEISPPNGNYSIVDSGMRVVVVVSELASNFVFYLSKFTCSVSIPPGDAA